MSVVPAPSILLPTSAAPRVSILIVAARQPQLLARCLESLARCGSEIPFETVVVLNDALPEVEALVHERVAGLTVTASSVPLGLAGGANRGRAAARGELLVLLHDDTEVEPGWLDALVAVADAHPEAGAVGSRTLDLDGGPQSMGSVLWSDGTVWTLGCGPAALVPLSETTTAVDYSGSSTLLVRTATWDALGGADERFYPAFYVDVDLCLGIWVGGQAVLCTPASRVRHHKSASTEARFREFLLRRNRERLREKWREKLVAFEPPASDSAEAVRRAVDRAQQRWRQACEVAAASPVPPSAVSSVPPFAPISQEYRVLEIALGLQQAWAGELSDRLGRALAERDLALAELGQQAALLAAIDRGRWWRLYGRLLPLFRFVRRLSRRAAANRTE